MPYRTLADFVTERSQVQPKQYWKCRVGLHEIEIRPNIEDLVKLTQKGLIRFVRFEDFCEVSCKHCRKLYKAEREDYSSTFNAFRMLEISLKMSAACSDFFERYIDEDDFYQKTDEFEG